MIGMVNGKAHYHKVPSFQSHMERASVGGIWCPADGMVPLKPVLQGDVVGKIFQPQKIQWQDISASSDGMLLQVGWPQLVYEGEELFNLGIRKI